MMVHWVLLTAALVVVLGIGWVIYQWGHAAWIAKNAIDAIGR